MDFLSNQQTNELLATYGYWIIALLIAIESTGIPVPGETMLIAASIYAGTSHHLNPALVILAASAGAIVGDNLGFLLGQQGGQRLLQKYGHYVRLDNQKLQAAASLFEAHGGKVVFFGRFVPFLRMWSAFLAGTSRMEWRLFLLSNATGGLVWASAYGAGGYLFGNAFAGLSTPLAVVSFVIATTLSLIVGKYFQRQAHWLSISRTKARLVRVA